MRRMGYETHSKVISIRTIKPPQHVQEKLKLAQNVKVTELQRLRFLNREPISIDVSYLPAQIGKKLAKEDLANRDVFTILENNLQVTLGYADLQISASIVKESMAGQLRVDQGSPILFIERIIHTSDGSPLEYEQLYYRGDAFQYKVRVDRTTMYQAS
jgi:GntR family transcriptional regulator